MAGHLISLNLFLLREGATAATTIRPIQPGADDGWIRSIWRVEADGIEPTEELPQDGSATTLVVRYRPSTSGWLGIAPTLFRGFPNVPDGVNAGAAFFQPVDGEMLLWTFGSGWTMIDRGQTDPRFGLRAGLNAYTTTTGETSKRKTGMTGIWSSLRASVARAAYLTTSRPAIPSEVERLDQTTDGAQAIQILTTHSSFPRVQAGRSLRFDGTVSDIDDLEKYGAEALRLSKLDDYRKSTEFNWVDNVIPVDGQGQISEVLEAVWNDGTHFNVVWADPGDESGVVPTSVRFPGERGDQGRTTLTWDSMSRWTTSKRSGLKGEDVMRTKLRWFVEDTQVSECEFWEVIVAEVDIRGTTYLISDGIVWEVAADFLKSLDEDLQKKVEINPKRYPSYELGQSEADFLRNCEKFGMLKMDQIFLRPEGQSKFESADLITSNGVLIHVKTKSRSSVLSHLTTQAMGSLQMLRSDSRARTDALIAVDKAVLERRKSKEKFPAISRNVVSMIKDHLSSLGGHPTVSLELAIVGDWRGEPTVAKLPLLTRLNLASWIRQVPIPTRIVLIGIETSKS